MQTKEITQLKNEIEDILNDNKAIEVKSINLFPAISKILK